MCSCGPVAGVTPHAVPSPSELGWTGSLPHPMQYTAAADSALLKEQAKEVCCTARSPLAVCCPACWLLRLSSLLLCRIHNQHLLQQKSEYWMRLWCAPLVCLMQSMAYWRWPMML